MKYGAVGVFLGIGLYLFAQTDGPRGRDAVSGTKKADAANEEPRKSNVESPPDVKPEARKPVSMSLGLPTLWTVEEAHYLLSRMSAVNTSLATKAPTPDDLDSNNINAAQLQTIRSALTGDVAYSQGAGIGNSILLQNYRADAARKQKLEGLRDGYVARQLALEDQISALQAAQATMTSNAASADALKQQQAAIDTKTTELKQVQDLTASADDQISKLNTTPPTFNSPGLPAQSTGGLPGTVFDQLAGKLADTGSMFRDPKLQATAALDNYFQMQYQIISRQLTLLRDDAGREDRVVFLEVPTGIYAVAGQGNGKAVQVRWEAIEWARACNPDRLRGLRPKAADAAGGTATDGWDLGFLHGFSTTRPVQSCPKEDDDSWTWEAVSSTTDNRLRVRAIELVPQQTAINVDQFLGKSNSSAFSAVFSWLSGFGAQARYQRQHDLAQRYITSEAHTSAFGKGSNLFGWNFAPLPTEKRLSGGERTTYAAMAVPKDAVAVKLHGVACYQKQNALPPAPVADQDRLPALSKSDGERCVERTGVVYIPSLRDMHPTIASLGYDTAPVGQRVTITLHGGRLSPQIGVLVNGVELQKEVAIAQHTAANPAVASAVVNGVSGSFEYVNSEFMILSFSVQDATHPPTITLVGPGFTKNLELSKTPHYVQGENPAKQTCDQFPMFGSILTLSALNAAALDTTSRTLSLRLDGTGLRNQPVTFQNSGGKPGTANCSADTFCRLSWQFDDLQKADLLTRPQWTFSVGPEHARGFLVPVEVSFDNPLLIRLDRSAPPKISWNLNGDGTVDTLHLEVLGTNLDPSLTYQITGVDGNYQAGDQPAFATGKAMFDAKAPDAKVTTVRFSATRAGTPLGDTLSSIKLPSRPAPPKADAAQGGKAN
jgi:hypothetical protein